MNPAQTLKNKQELARIIVALGETEDTVFRAAVDGAMGALDLRCDTEFYGDDAPDLFYEKLNTMDITYDMVLSIVQDFTTPYSAVASAMAAGRAMSAELSAKSKFERIHAASEAARFISH